MLREKSVLCWKSNFSFVAMPATTRKRQREDTLLPPVAPKSVGKKSIAKGKRKSVVVSPAIKRTGKFSKPKLKVVSPIRKKSVRKSRRTVDTDVDKTLNESDLTLEVEAVSSSSDRCEKLERELRLLKLEEELADLRSSESKSVSESCEKEVVPVPVQVERGMFTDSRFRLQMPAGLNNLGTFNGKSDLETFLSRFENCSEYFGWNEKDKLFQLKNSLIEAAGFVVSEIGPGAKLCEIIQLLKLRFGNENQMERFRAELKSRRRKPGESLQHLFQDLCRLKTLAFGKTAESDFSKLYLRDVFLDSLNDRKLRKLILIQEPSTMEEALRVANHLEAIDATESNDSDREYTSHTSKKKLRNLDVVSGSAAAAKDGRDMEKQLAEMKKTLDDVRQELSRQVTLSSNNQSRNTVGMPRTTSTDESSVTKSSTGRRQAQAEHFVGSPTVVDNNTCRYCKKVGHWAQNCPRLRQNNWTTDTWTRDVTKSKSNVDDRTETQVLNSPTKNKCRSEAHLEIRLRSKKMCALLDTGCDHSVIGSSIIPDAVLQPTSERLYTADGTELPLLGEIKTEFSSARYLDFSSCCCLRSDSRFDFRD